MEWHYWIVEYKNDSQYQSYSIKCHIMMHAVRQVLFLEHYSQTEAYIKETLF